MNIKAGFLRLFLVFLALSIYYPTLYAPYNSLDDQLLVHQLLNQENFSFVRHFAPGGTYDYYRPLVTLTFAVDKYVGGLQESFMHLLNILLHALNVVLIFELALRFAVFIGRDGNLLPFLSAGLFCLHPLNTEAVNWISARTDLLAGAFVFSSIIFILKALERRSLIWGGAGVLALFGGFLCKETALFLLPGIFFLLVWRPTPARATWPGRCALIGLCLVAVLGYFALRWGAYNTDRGLNHTAKFVAQMAAGVPAVHVSRSDSHSIVILDVVRVMLKVSGFYVSKLFQPLPLNFAINRIHWGFLVPGVLLAATLPVLAIRRRPVGVFFLLTAFLGSSAFLVVFTRLAWTPIAERYMYIPCGLFAVAAVFGTADLVERFAWQKYCLAVVPLLFGIYGWATVDRNIVWQDNLTLYQDTVRKSPDFGPANNELALALYSHNRPAEAASVIATAKIPSGQKSSLNQAAAFAEQGRYREALIFLRQRLVNPGSNEIHILVTLVRVASEAAEKSKVQTEKNILYRDIVGWLERLEFLTHDPFHWYQLGRVHMILKNKQEAQRCFSKAAIRLPADSIYKEPAAKLARKLVL